jgi:carboxymethylenebutenolidase
MTSSAPKSPDAAAPGESRSRSAVVTLCAPDGTRFEAYVTAPPSGEGSGKGSGQGPGLILLSGETGPGGPTRLLADRFAAEGYAVVAPDLSRHALADDACASAYRDAIADIFIARAGLAPHLEAGARIGLIAVGSAAACGWRLAAQQSVDALVVFGAAGLAVALEAAPQIACPVALHLAGSETTAASDEISALRKAVAGRPWFRIHDYAGCKPGFADSGTASFDRHAQALAHSRSLAVLRPAIGPRYDLAGLFQEHLLQEFVHKDPHATMATMVDMPYVNHVPTLTGGYGHDVLKRFYTYHFIPKISDDRNVVMISETVGADTVVLEMVNKFTHDRELDYFLPGVPPTGRQIEIAVVVIAKFRGDKLYHEHIYWDQASVLAQIGLIDPTGLPVAGAEEARKMLDQTLPANELMKRWQESEGKPI